MTGNVQTTDSLEQGVPYFPFYLDFHSAPLTEEQFEELCRNNRDLKFEVSSKGELIIVAPTSPESGWRNIKLSSKVEIWSEEDGSGIAFDSSTLFNFPNGAKRSPDVSWMTKEKWEAVPPSERRKFSHVVPDFVIELLSPTDSLAAVKAKMAEYIENGVRLGWLIDPDDMKVYVYRTDSEPEVLDDPEKVLGENVLPGFELNLGQIW